MLVLAKPGLHHKLGTRAFSQHHLLTSGGEGPAKGTVWSPAAAGALMLHSWPSLRFFMGTDVSMPDLAVVAMLVEERSASNSSTKQMVRWPLKHALGELVAQRKKRSVSRSSTRSPLNKNSEILYALSGPPKQPLISKSDFCLSSSSLSPGCS